MAEVILDYAELKLRIEPGPDGSYRVLAFGPDGGTATGTFAPPFGDAELDSFVLRVGLPRRAVRAYRSSQMEEAKSFGARLFDALIQGDVRDVYERARRHAELEGQGLRITFYLTGVPELMQIPWEFIYERPRFLSQSIYTPVVRSLDLKGARPPRRVVPPLRVLGIVSRPEDAGALDVTQEQEKLGRALAGLADTGMVQLEWLERATLAELERRLSQPDEIHVLHYIGHGAYDERTQGGILLLEDEHGRGHEVTGEELGSLLQDEHGLRLVVLNACEGARTSHVDPFSGVASSLVEHGIPAVVGMQFEITDRAAITLADRLFGAVAHGFPVDAALAQARKAIFAAGSDIEFGTPVLFLRGSDARLFDVEARPAGTSGGADPGAGAVPSPAAPVAAAATPPLAGVAATAPGEPAPSAAAAPVAAPSGPRVKPRTGRAPWERRVGRGAGGLPSPARRQVLFWTLALVGSIAAIVATDAGSNSSGDTDATVAALVFYVALIGFFWALGAQYRERRRGR
jgi:CHAT domain